MKPRTYRWDKGLRVRVLGLIVFLLTIIFILAIVLSISFARLADVQERAQETRESILHMELITGTFAEMTSAVRGYVMTGDEVFLQPYVAGQVEMSNAFSQLRNSFSQDSEQLTRLYQMNEMVTNWKQKVAEPEIAARRAGKPEAGKLITQGGGLNYIDEIRRAGQSVISVENLRLNDEMASASRAATNVQWATWLGTGAAALFAMAGFLVFAGGVTRATAALAAAAESIAKGERGVVMVDTLDGEFQEVAQAFNSMSMELSAQEEELHAQQEELVAQNEELASQGEELHKRTEALERHDKRLSRLNNLGELMIGTIDVDQLGRLVVDEYIELYGGTAGALLLATDYSDRMVVQTERWLASSWRRAIVPISGPLARCVEQCQVVIARYPESQMRISAWQTNMPVAQEVYIPLVHTGRVLAVVVVAFMETAEEPEEAVALWGSIARQSAVALAAALNHQELSRSLLALQEQAAQVEELNSQLEEERDRAAAQLDIYLSIVSTMQAGAWLTDNGGHLLVVNDTFTKFFGELPPDVSLEDALGILGPQLDGGETFVSTVRALVASRDGSGEGTVRLKNGYVLQWYSAPVGRETVPVGRLFTFQDVTELTKLDHLKSEFVSTVSHELRTPLTSIMGYLSLVMNEQVGSLSPMQKEFLEVVSRNTSRLGNLINDLLDIQRIESGRSPIKLQPVSVSKVVRQAAETFRVAAEQKKLDFELDLPEGDDPLISADPERLVQITSNLISNAVKYTREGTVRITVSQVQNEVMISISDTGIGIAPAEQERVFEKFYRGEDKYAREAGGTGLGLPIVKELVEEHGGTICLRSEVGKGSTFTIIFPAETAAT